MGRKRRVRREQRRFIEMFKKDVGKEAAKHFPGFRMTLNGLPVPKRLVEAAKLAVGRL